MEKLSSGLSLNSPRLFERFNMKRKKTPYPGIFFREARRIGGKGTEKVYYIVFKKDGKVHEEKVGRQFSDDMSPARAARIRSERIEGKRLSRKELRIRKESEQKIHQNKWTIERLWAEYKTQRFNNKSLKVDEGRYNKYLREKFGQNEPKDIIQLDIDRLRINLLKKRSPQTVKHVLALLKRIVKFGAKKGLCEDMAFTIEMPRVDNQKTEDLFPEQLNALLKAIDESPNIQAANMMRLALFTGMRRGEMFKLKWADIDEQRGFINIRDPKGGPSQKIPLNKAARELLESHVKTGSPYVFPGRGGRQRTDIKHQVNRIKEKAGLPKGFRALHGLRHVYASMLASSGQVDMYTLQKLLTHKSPLMTQRYAHLRDETLRQASDLAGKIISQAQEETVSNLKKVTTGKRKP